MLMLAFSKMFISEIQLISDMDVVKLILEKVKRIILERGRHKKLVCDDIKMLKYSNNPSVGGENDRHEFSFMETLTYGYSQGEITLDEFINDINEKRRFTPLDTKSNGVQRQVICKSDFEICKSWYPYITDNGKIRDIIMKDLYGCEKKVTAIDVINIIRKALNGEIVYDMRDSDPNWDSCDCEMYNVDTRFFTFYKNQKTSFAHENLLKDNELYKEIKYQQDDERTRSGFIWVNGTNHDDEYGRLFIKPDNNKGHKYWMNCVCDVTS